MSYKLSFIQNYEFSREIILYVFVVVDNEGTRIEMKNFILFNVILDFNLHHGGNQRMYYSTTLLSPVIHQTYPFSFSSSYVL